MTTMEIYADEVDAEVIHFTGEKASSASIQGCSLEHFSGGEEVRLVAYNVSFLEKIFKIRPGTYHGNSVKCYNPATVVEIAKTYLHNPDSWIREHGPYNLYSNNCEHFAHYCKTGEFCSMQSCDGRSLADYVTDLLFLPKLIINAPKTLREATVLTLSEAICSSGTAPASTERVRRYVPH